MAITWGGWKQSGSTKWRLGYEFTQSPATIAYGTSSCTVTLNLYLETNWGTSDSVNSFTVSGDFSRSGSVGISIPTSGGVVLLTSLQRTFTPSYTSTTTSSFTASLSGVEVLPGTITISGSHVTAKRPIGAPAAPTGCAVSRNSDGSQTITWANTSPSSTSNPYTQLIVERWSASTNTWVQVATLGVTTSYTDYGTSANNRYRYRVKARNSAGDSVYSTSDYIVTTPAAPTSLAAEKTSDGDIKLTWTNAATYHTGIEVWVTENGVDAGSAHTTLAAGVTEWTHTAPNAAKTWAYRLKAVATSPELKSAFSSRSNTVQLLTNPLAPTNLAPASTARDLDEGVTLSWQHNPVDGSPQTAYEIEHRLQGAGSWDTTGKVNSSDSSGIALPGSYANGDTVEWRVRTWGLYDNAPAYSEWSTAALIILSARPTAVIQYPEADTPVETSSLTVEWAFYDAEGGDQAQWRATLLDANSAVLEVLTGATADETATFIHGLADGSTYTVRVEVRDEDGLWSVPGAEVTFDVIYALPVPPEIAGIYDPDTGSTIITIDNFEPGEDEVETVSNELWVSDDEETWYLLAEGIPPSTTVVDYIPRLGRPTYYRAVAISALPSRATSAAIEVEANTAPFWVWINAGPDFQQAVRVRDDAAITDTFGRAKVLKQRAGRRKPVEHTGEQRTRTISLSAKLALVGDATERSSTPDEIYAIAEQPAPVCVREPDGTRYFVSTGAPSISKQGVSAELTWEFSEVDYGGR